MINVKQMLRLYFVAGTQDCQHLEGDPQQNLLQILQQALKAGISCFQFRDKGEGSLAKEPKLQYQLALQCRDLCRQYSVPFVVNDDLELALAVDADVIHVGQQDTSVESIMARRTKKLLLGLSINNMQEALANKDNPHIDYFGVGPVFPTQSKADHSPALGVEIFRQLREAGITKPCVAIGGINQQNAQQLRKLGADGIAVISAITQASNIADAIDQLVK